MSFSSGNTFTARLGMRLAAHVDGGGARWEPYFRASLLRAFGAGDSLTFGGGTAIPGSVGQTAAQLGAGLVARWSRQGSAFATVGWLTNIGGAHQRTVTGNAGVRWIW